MPRRDLYHEAVKNALVKDGWTITHDPLAIGTLKLRVYPDLGCEKADNGKHLRIIAVEIKVFGNPKEQTSKLEKAVGQYSFYRSILRNTNSPRGPYLAVPTEVYHKLFQIDIVRDFIRDQAIKLIVFNPETQEVEKWID